MLNSAEHEIFDAHKYKNKKKMQLLSGSNKLRMPSIHVYCFLLINIKMPTSGKLSRHGRLVKALEHHTMQPNA